jgi:DNA-binding IclR family transcriptional regulator
MGCVNPDGSLTPVALQMLRALSAMPDGGDAESIARISGRPLYRARSSLRELEAGGFVALDKGAHRLTSAGRARLATAPAIAASGGLEAQR